MAYANTAIASPGIRVPHVTLPNLRWLRLSRRTRALLMMGVMISPCFLSDAIGYCVQRLFLTADQIAAREAPDAMLAQISKVDVACPGKEMSAEEQGRWAAYAAQQGWSFYPQAGPGCFKPDRNLRGVLALKVFSVACPTTALSALDERRWIAYAADHGWDAYPRAGTDCVDP
ncbi:MAG TPA: hypothetical protein VME47_15235 [Acetobacteraceae bacterium]|nr:hypothetical protein [Acetobacteraceae bacterium]